MAFEHRALPREHLLRIIIRSFGALSAKTAVVLGFFSWCCTRFCVAKPTHPPGKKDGTCHLLVGSEGEMTFEHPAKCERSLSSHALLSDVITVILAACPKRGVHMASSPLRVVKKGTLHLAS